MSNSITRTSTSKKARITVWIVVAAAVAAMVALVIAQNGPSSAAPADGGQAVRENSRVLSQAPNEKAQLVEFLDFECEACRAAHPFVEELRAEYGQRLTVINRYFPLPGHRNSMNAALAVEAAALQGQYEPMYQKMFATQSQWGESTEDKSTLFRTFAQELGLDLAAYDQAVADPATRERIETDIADGTALGVSGTPTFFLNGQKISPASLEEFKALIEAAVTSPE